MTSTTAALPERRINAGEPLHLVEELRDLAAHTNLLRELIHRDLTVRYKRSPLGFLWTMLHPLAMMLIFVVVFSTLFRFELPNYSVYFLSEYIGWNFFAQTTIGSMTSIAWNGSLLKRVRVPPTIFTLSTTLSGAVNLVLSVLMLMLIMLVTGAPFSITMLMLPVSCAILMLFTLGASLALTAIAVFFADVREMYQAAIPAIMYLTPIIYPITIVPDRFRWLVKLNPLVYVLEVLRDPIYYGIVPAPKTFALAAVMSVASVAIGWLIFRQLAPRFHAHL